MGITNDKSLSVESQHIASLRRLAEKRLSADKAGLHPSRTGEEAQRLVHELEVRQVELEMQNAELRRTQEELEVSKNKYTGLYDLAPVGYFTFNARGVIKEVNLTGAQLLGTERRLLADAPFTGFIAGAGGREIFFKHLESTLKSEAIQRCEVKLTGKRGAVIHAQLQSVTVGTVESKDGYILSSIVDGTLGKKLESEIQDAREYAENIVETVREPLVVLNSDLKILTANHSFYETFKVTPEETIGNFIYDLGNGQWDIPGLRVLFEEILPHDTVINGYEVEHDFPCIGLKTILLNARQIFRENIGSRIILLAMEDITARKQLEEELQAAHEKLELIVSERTRELAGANVQLKLEIEERKHSEESLRMSNFYNRSLIEASIDPFVTIDLEGKISDVNTATEKITGYSRIELIGDDFSEHFTEPGMARESYQLVISEGAVRNYPLQISHRDGHVTSVLYSASVFRDEDGELEGVFAAARDITEQKTLESQLFQAQKMEAIGQLAGGIAHDFNNIITGIIGFSTLVEMSMEKDDPQRDNLKHVLVAAERAAELTKSLLAFSRKQIINPQPVDLNRIINKTEQFLKRVIGEDIDFRMIFHQDVLTVHADNGQIEQVLMNLATNARDAMPQGGMLSIETSSVEMDADFIKAHGYGEPGKYALISISDDGVGMDEITRKRLFEPFFTTKELGKGTGLGLSIVYGIVKQHNGYINVYSEPGIGTTFSIYLPLLRADTTKKTTQVDEILKGGTETLLVVDDDASVLLLAEKVLEQFGYTVITAVDGQDALVKFSEGRESIALVILDVIMPKMNGKEAFDAILKIRPDMKALFISGYTADIIHKRGMLDESLEFIDKPLRPINLLLKVREILDKTF